MRESRRISLRDQKPVPSANPGLWFDCFMEAQLTREEQVPPDTDSPKETHIKQVSRFKPDQHGYERFFNRWKDTLRSGGAKTEVAHAYGRVAVNLGAQSITENSLALHHTYGVPYLPGSALKGLVASYARNHLIDDWDSQGENYRYLFGDQDRSGAVNFFDALYVPESGFRKQALWPDVITVHHPDYYQGSPSPPADWDSPTINHFLSATGSFVIAIKGPEEWVDAVFEILDLALWEQGIGAKTSSGYGRLYFGEPPEENFEKIETYAEKKNRLLNEEQAPEGRVRSIVRDVKSQGDFGFTNNPSGGGAIFIHPDNYRENRDAVKVGTLIEYKIVETTKGLQARDIDVLLEPED